jgi:hypothetical protein
MNGQSNDERSLLKTLIGNDKGDGLTVPASGPDGRTSFVGIRPVDALNNE